MNRSLRILALDEEEDDQHQDDAGARQGLHHRRQGAADSLQRAGLGGNHPHRPRALIRLHLLVEVANGAIDALRETPEAAPLAPPQREHLALDRIRVLGHLGGQRDDLALEEVAEPDDRGQRDEDHDRHRRDTAEPALQEPDRGTEREGHHNRQRQRNEESPRRARERRQSKPRWRARPSPAVPRAPPWRPRVLADWRSPSSGLRVGIGGSPGTR